MKSLKTIEQIASRIAPGFTPSFNEVHVLKALEIIDSSDSIGRGRLSKAIRLGEGTTRTLIRHLRKADLIKIGKPGMVLSKTGKELLSEITSRLSKPKEIPKSSLTIGPFNVAVLVRNASDFVNYGIEQRDSAIKIGALGATTLVFKEGELVIPGEENAESSKTEFIKQLISPMEPEEKDVLIIGSAENREIAEYGAKAAAIELLKTED